MHLLDYPQQNLLLSALNLVSHTEMAGRFGFKFTIFAYLLTEAID